jgi:membrane fusion protein (multidrug efflux system)
MKVQGKFVLVMAILLFISVALFSAQPEKALKCPRKVKVEATEIKGENFTEYAHFKKEIAPLTAVMKSAVDGQVQEAMFQAGDEVKSGDILVKLDAAALNQAVKEAEAAVTQWEKTLKTRKAWKARSEKAEKQKVDLYTIKSGLDGRVGKMNVAAGMDVAAGTELAVIVNDGIMKFALAGDEVASLSDKEKVFVRFDELSSGMDGEVSVLAPNQVEIVLANGDRKLRAGLQASLKLLKKEYSDAIILRREQVLQDEAGAYAYLAENGRAKRMALSLGAEEDGRVLVLAGLEKGRLLIVKGAECLFDGKKIKIVNKLPEKAEIKAEEKPVQPEVKKEEPVAAVETKVKAHKKFKAGVNLEYRYVTGEGFSGLYGRAIGGGVELSYQFSGKMDFWVSASYSGKTKTLDWVEGTSKYTMIPFSAGIKYYWLQKEKLTAFAGAGLNYVIYKNTDPFSEVKENLIGPAILGGASLKLSESFYGQAALQFNLVKKTLTMTPAPDFQLDLSNFELKIGVFYTF